MKVLEDNIEDVDDLGFGNGFLNTTQKSQFIKEKNRHR